MSYSANFQKEKAEAHARSNMLGTAILATFTIIFCILIGVVVVKADVPQRGFQIGTYPVPTSQIQLSVKDAYTMFGSNVVRYQIVDPTITNETPIEDYYEWWDGKITELIEVLRYIKETHIPIQVIVDMHTAPGGVIQKHWGAQHWVASKEGGDTWSAMWVHAINRINATPWANKVLAWEPVNEPAAKSSRGLWNKYRKLIRQLRNITDKPIIVSMARRDVQWYNKAKPFPARLGEIWYTAHHYKPNDIGFYNILPQYDTVRYEKAIAKYKRKPYKAVRQHLRPLYKFSKKHNVRAFIGEFGVSREVPDKERAFVFKTTLEQFNNWGFSWTIHALNEHPIWQPTKHSLTTIKDAIHDNR